MLHYGTYGESPQLLRSWPEHIDDLALVTPFDLPAEQITDTIEAISWPVTDRRPNADAAVPRLDHAGSIHDARAGVGMYLLAATRCVDVNATYEPDR